MKDRTTLVHILCLQLWPIHSFYLVLAKPVCYKTVADVSKNNLSGHQRELIQWHSKLCINMNLVQELMLNPVLISLVSSKTIIEKKIKVAPIKTGNYLYQDAF